MPAWRRPRRIASVSSPTGTIASGIFRKATDPGRTTLHQSGILWRMGEDGASGIDPDGSPPRRRGKPQNL
jgi:hypothetical protein